MLFAGQTEAHLPQCVQSSVSITASFSFRLIA